MYTYVHDQFRLTIGVYGMDFHEEIDGDVQKIVALLQKSKLSNVNRRIKAERKRKQKNH